MLCFAVAACGDSVASHDDRRKLAGVITKIIGVASGIFYGLAGWLLAARWADAASAVVVLFLAASGAGRVLPALVGTRFTLLPFCTRPDIRRAAVAVIQQPAGRIPPQILAGVDGGALLPALALAVGSRAAPAGRQRRGAADRPGAFPHPAARRGRAGGWASIALVLRYRRW